MSMYQQGGGGGGGRPRGSSSMSGTAYDRWSYEQSSPGSNDTAINKLQHKYWVAKQAVQRKLGKDEDEHVIASDSELDAKLELFRSINDTTCRLQRMIEHYQDRLCNLSYEENCLGRFLKEYGKADKTRAGKMMVAVGKTMGYSGQQRLAIRVPLVRLYQEVETFRQRAIEDTFWTVKRMEKSRTEYRGALMWMKNVSQELDPDTYKQLEKFRKVQGHVKQSKSRFDKLKLDCLQKVDLLAASRCNMFSHALIMYQNALIAFWEKTAKTMNHVNESFKGYQHFEFSYIKDLAEPKRDLEEEADDGNKSKERRAKKKEKAGGEKETKDDKFFFNPDFTDEPKKGEGEKEAPAADKPSNDLAGLLDLPSGGDQHQQRPVLPPLDDDALLDFGDDDTPVDHEKALEGMPTLTPSVPLPRPSNEDDALLLEELMSSDGGAAAGSSSLLSASAANASSTGSFAAQWDKMMSATAAASEQESSDVFGGEFGQFMSSSSALGGGEQGNLGKGLLQAPLAGGAGGKAAPSSSSSQAPEAFLPSQLCDRDQSFHPGSRKDEEDLLKDFPMPSPSRPAAVQKQLEEKKKKQSSGDKKGASAASSDMSQWFSLFADLDPLSNPDAIGKTTKEEDKNCYS